MGPLELTLIQTESPTTKKLSPQIPMVPAMRVRANNSHSAAPTINLATAQILESKDKHLMVKNTDGSKSEKPRKRRKLTQRA